MKKIASPVQVLMCWDYFSPTSAESLRKDFSQENSSQCTEHIKKKNVQIMDLGQILQ